MTTRPNTPPPVAALDERLFRQTLARFATGVTVVTAPSIQQHADDTNNGGFVGMTVNSFNSVSMAPPLVLWSVSHRARGLTSFLQASHYVINVLAADQLELCERFAYGQGDRFAGLNYGLSAGGSPILPGVLAWFDCRNRSRYDEGDHTIMVGEVLAFGHRNAAGAALIYQGGHFGQLQPLEPTRHDQRQCH